MAILNFPSNPNVGDQYTGDNGTTYIWDGVKWVGHAAAGTAGTNSIYSGSNVLQVDSGGNLIAPAYTFPNTTGTTGQVLSWPGSGTTLVWTTQSGGSGGPTDRLISPDTTKTFILDNTGTLTLPSGGSLTNDNGLLGPEGGYSYISDYNQNNYFYVDENSSQIVTLYGQWTFDNDGNITLPLVTKMNSGGINTTNSVEFGTEVATDPYPPFGIANITNSEIYMSGGSAESRIITNASTGSLIYTGVENVELPGFAGMVAIDPNVDSQYSIDIDSNGNILLGAVQEYGTLTSTDGYTAGLGVLNYNYTINGILANQSITALTGSIGISMKTDRGQIWFGNQPEPGGPTHFHIMKGSLSYGNMDLIFGDDFNFIKLPYSEDNVTITATTSGIQATWQFSGDEGTLTLPNGSEIYALSPTNTVIAGPQNFSIYTTESPGWTFQTDDGLRFPDNTVQTTAWDYRNLENIDMDGGAASTVYSVNVRFAEGGAAGTRFSNTDPNYNGASAYGAEPEFTLDGGRA